MWIGWEKGIKKATYILRLSAAKLSGVLILFF
jgi:hypothetical protein